MSASLVGSEMCIRDSRREETAHPSAMGSRCQGRSRSDARRPDAEPEPVSYTHLTLPTICSV
eukprot:11949890-Alexandrium_andersonii.AAC.1